MSELVLLLSAEIDVQAAFDRYEDYQESRGVIFLQHLEAAFDQLRRFPESGKRFHRSYRRLLVPQFPYGVFYSVEARGIVVTGVLDTRQDPQAIHRRLRKDECYFAGTGAGSATRRSFACATRGDAG